MDQTTTPTAQFNKDPHQLSIIRGIIIVSHHSAKRSHCISSSYRPLSNSHVAGIMEPYSVHTWDDITWTNILCKMHNRGEWSSSHPTILLAFLSTHVCFCMMNYLFQNIYVRLLNASWWGAEEAKDQLKAKVTCLSKFIIIHHPSYSSFLWFSLFIPSSNKQNGHHHQQQAMCRYDLICYCKKSVGWYPFKPHTIMVRKKEERD